MRFAAPLRPARLIQRYKRFLADVVFPDGAAATAHVPNSGAMLGVSTPGSTVWLSPAPAGRKLPYTLRLVEAVGPHGAELAGVDTHLPNALVDEALRAHAIPELAGYAAFRREVRFADASRVDFLLESPGRPPCYLEVKNVHLKRHGRLAEFPDCTAARSARHMAELAHEAQERGARAVALFVVQRENCDAFAPAEDLDPAFARALRAAVEAGVEALAYACALGPEEVRLDRRIAARLSPTHADRIS